MALIDVNWKPGAKELRQFALLFLIFGGVFGTLIYFFKDWPLLVSQIMWIGGAVVGLAGLAVPALVRPVYVVMMALALPIGMVVSTVLMVVIYFLVLTPIGLLMRLLGHDPMRRTLDPAATTHWIERPRDIPASRYFKQY
jgi:hypothetical protein